MTDSRKKPSYIFKTLRKVCLFLLLISISLISKAEGVWRHHPAFFTDVAQVIDTPSKSYLLLHGDYYDRYVTGFTTPVLSLFSWDTSTPGALPQSVSTSYHDLHFVQYHPQARCLVVVYYSGVIELIYDDGRIETILGYADVAVPYDRTVNSSTIDTGRQKVYLATGWGWMVIDLKNATLQQRIFTQRPTDWVATDGTDTYVVMEDQLFSTTGLPEDVSPKALFTPVEAVFTGSEKPSPVLDITRLLPLNNTLAFLQEGTPATLSKVMVLERNEDAAFECREIGEFTLSWTERRFTPSLRDQLAINVTSDGYIFDTSDSLIRLEAIPSGEDTSISLRTIAKPMKDCIAASYGDDRLIQYIKPTGVGESGFSCYNLSGSGYTLSASGVRPLAPVTAVTDNMTYHPRYGIIIANHGNSIHFTETGVESPARLSVYGDNRWTPFTYLIDPPAFSTETAHRTRWNTYKNRYPVTFPRGLAVDPDNDRYLYTGSWFYGIARYDLDDRTSPVLRMAQKNGVAYTLPGFAAIAPRQKSSYYLCLFTNPTFDADGTLWSAYFNLDGNTTGEGFQLWYWTRENRAAADVNDPETVAGWSYLTVPGQRFHGNGRLLPLRHESNRNCIVAYSNNYDSPLVVYDHRGTLDDTTDDRIITLPTLKSRSHGGIVNKARIFSIAEHPVSGDVWIGTDMGCFIARPGELFETAVVSLPEVMKVKGKESDTNPVELTGVSAIEFDGSGNVWLGTSGNGLFCLSADGKELLHHFSADATPLPHDFIYSLCWNPDHNSMMISTGLGISEYYTEGLPDSDPEKKVRMTPAHVNSAYTGYVTFSNLPAGIKAQIVDSNGNLILNLGTPVDGMLQWNGHDWHNRRVATGKYTLINSETKTSLFEFDFMK